MASSVMAAARATFEDLSATRAWLASRDHDLLQLQVAVAGIPAPTGGEQRRAAWVAERLTETGLQPSIDDAGNVVARLDCGARQPPVVVCAHLDTVFPEDTTLEFRHDGNRVTGPGICDNSRGLAVMLMLARAVAARANSFVRPIEFVATTGEEGRGDLRGAKHYLADRPRPFAVVAIDGAGDERIVNTGLGSRRFRVTFRGPGGHSWAAFGAANPIHAAARAVASLADIRPAGAARLALSVSRIGGGISINAIPEESWIEVDARATAGALLDMVERELRTIVSDATRAENDRRSAGSAALTSHIERIGDRPGGETPGDAPLVIAAMEATRLVGRAPELATASTDANAAMGLGVPAIAIGGGGKGGDTHSSREWFDNTAASAGVERALTIVAAMARMD
jgi:tripeptide aminopeptidase